MHAQIAACTYTFIYLLAFTSLPSATLGIDSLRSLWEYDLLRHVIYISGASGLLAVVAVCSKGLSVQIFRMGISRA